jgi:hypothetical protein
MNQGLSHQVKAWLPALCHRNPCAAPKSPRHTVHVAEPEYVDDFICTCGVESDATVAVADHLREDARRILAAGTDGWCPGEVTDRNFVDAAVGYLNEYSSHIAEIVTDQWSLVEIVAQRYNPDIKELETILVLRIQCDRVEDGVARAVQMIAERGRP